MSSSNGVKNVLAAFEKTIKENNEAGVTSSMYLSNILTKPAGKNTLGTRDNNATNTLGRSAEDDDWTTNSSVHSGFAITETPRTNFLDGGDSSTESFDSFGDGDGDDDFDWEVPSVVDDINESRSKREQKGRVVTRRRLVKGEGSAFPETIFESAGGSKHDSTSGDSKHSRHSLSRSKSSQSRRKKGGNDSDDSDSDSFG